MAQPSNTLKDKLAQREIKILRQITDSIAYNLDPEEVLKEIVDVVYQETNADSVFVYVFDEESGKLVLQASKNPHPNLLGKITLKLGEGITGWVAEHKKPVEIEKSASDDPRFKFFHNIPEDRYEAFLSLPITFRSKLIGVINIQYRNPQKHTKDQINLLSTIAKQVGGAIENARLVEQSQALKEALQARKLIDQAKGILIRKNSFSEPAAYAHLQKLAMKYRKSLREVAEAIIMIENGQTKRQS